MCEYIQRQWPLTNQRPRSAQVAALRASMAFAVLLGVALQASGQDASASQPTPEQAPPAASAAEGVLQRKSLAALTPAQAGQRITAAVEAALDGYGDLTVDLTMVLRSKSGSETLRELTIAQLEVPGEGDQTMVTFKTPKAVRGTGLLSHSHNDRPDDQWLFLPAFNRVKKIASRNRSGPFLGSEFAFEDLTAQPLEKFNDRLLGETDCEFGRCWEVERIPLDRFSGYARQHLLIDQAELRVLGITYYDREDRLKKTLVASEFELQLGRFWRPRRMLMSNARTGRSTLLKWQDFRYRQGLTAARDFSVNALKRVR